MLTPGLGSTDSRIDDIAPRERGTATKAAIKRAQQTVADLRSARAAERQQLPAITAPERLRAKRAQEIESDLIDLMIDALATDREIAVEIGEPDVDHDLVIDCNEPYYRGERYWPYRGKTFWRKCRTKYTITLAPRRTFRLLNAGLRSGVVDGRLILSAHPVYATDWLTVLACVTAVWRCRSGGLLVEQDTRRGHDGPRLRYLAVWRGAGEVESRWHKTADAALESRPLNSEILQALVGLTERENDALAEIAA